MRGVQAWLAALLLTTACGSEDAVEKTPPHLPSVVEFDAEALTEADRLVTQAIATYAECCATGRWPGYPPGIHLASLPPWMLTGPQTLGDFVADSYLYDTDPLEES